MIVPPDPLFPSPTEQVIADLSRVMAGREFESLEDANAFLQDVTSAGPLPTELPATPQGRAQQLVYRAMEKSGKERVALARKALSLSKDCADAYIILATETATSVREEIKLFRQAVQAAERALKGSDYEEHLPHLWGFVPGRPYLRALFGLALAEWHRGARLAGIEHLRRVLAMSEEDSTGVRYYLLGWLLDIDDIVLARDLVGRYPEQTAMWLWADALLTFKEKGETTARTRLRKARQANPLVPDLLISEDEHEDPTSDLEVEALSIVDHLGRPWIRDLPAVWWLEAELNEDEAGAVSRGGGQGGRKGRMASEEFDDTLDDPSGLDGDALMRLFAAPLGSPGSGVVLGEDLSLTELADSEILFNARLFLARAAPADVRATGKGNLNQAFVREMAQGMRLSPEDEGWIDRQKPGREDSFRALRTLREVLVLAELLDEGPRSFALTTEGLRLLADDQAGALQAHLFRIFFGRFDLAFLDRMDEDHLLQATLPYTLYMMSREAGGWLGPGELRDLVLIEEARDLEAEAAMFDESLWRFESRIVRPLIAFGLLERRSHPAPPADAAYLDRYYQVRRAPLFDRFLRFDLE